MSALSERRICITAQNGSAHPDTRYVSWVQNDVNLFGGVGVGCALSSQIFFQGVGSNPLSVDLLNRIQDSQLVSARVINYYDQRVESTFEELGFETGNLGSTSSQASSNADNFETANLDSLNGGEDPEDIQTIVDEILARSEETQTGTLLDLNA